MFGLKINYHKSEVFVLGVNGEEAQKVANIFYCKLAHLSMKYLGILVRDRYVGVKAVEAVVDKLVRG